MSNGSSSKVFTRSEILGRLSERKVPLDELEDRFLDLNHLVDAKVNFNGWIPNLKRYGPFDGRLMLRSIISLMEQDISVELKNDDDIRKFRNSVIFYNEYFVPNSELNTQGFVPAYKAYTQIQDDYLRIMARMGIHDGTSIDTRHNPYRIFEKCRGYRRVSFEGASSENEEKYHFLVQQMEEEKRKKNIVGMKSVSEESEEEFVPFYREENKRLSTHRLSVLDWDHLIPPFYDEVFGTDGEEQYNEDFDGNPEETDFYDDSQNGENYRDSERRENRNYYR